MTGSLDVRKTAFKAVFTGSREEFYNIFLGTFADLYYFCTHLNGCKLLGDVFIK